MNTFELKNYGVLEMNAAEMRETDGGIAWTPFLLGAIAGGLTYDLAKAAYLKMCKNYQKFAVSNPEYTLMVQNFSH